MVLRHHESPVAAQTGAAGFETVPVLFEVSQLFARLIVSIAVVASTATVSTPVRAFELFGVCLIKPCEPDPEETVAFIDPVTYEATADVEGKAGGREIVEGLSELWLRRNEPVGGDAGLLARARGDYERILGGFYNEGFYAPGISITINGREAADIPQGTEFGENPKVRLNVTVGPRYRFGKTEVVNAAPSPDKEDDAVATFPQVDFEPTQKARATTIRKASRLAVEAWRQQGHAKARIAERKAVARHNSDILDVLLRVEPGLQAHYGPVSVEGARRMDPEFVAYMAGLELGREYDPDDLARARKRLERLGVFSLYRLGEADEIGPDGLLPITIKVDERKLRRIGAGVTASTTEGLGLQGYWLHRNLFGRAERLRIEGKVGGIGSEGNVDSVDDIDYSLGATLTLPGVINPDIDSVNAVLAEREVNETFTEESIRGSSSLRYYRTADLTLEGGIFGEYGEFTDDFGTRRFFSTGLDGTARLDKRNDRLEPTEGFYLDARVTPFQEWEFGNTIMRAEAEARGYYSPGDSGRTVLAGRFKVGAIGGASLIETPPDYLFLAGGGGSVRGYAFKNIGVRDAAGRVSGGRALVEGSIELRQRFGESFGAVLFADAGSVHSDWTGHFAEDFQIGVGGGLRYYTGLGAIRLDIAFPLDPKSGDPDFALYAGLGQAF